MRLTSLMENSNCGWNDDGEKNCEQAIVSYADSAEKDWLEKSNCTQLSYNFIYNYFIYHIIYTSLKSLLTLI